MCAISLVYLSPQMKERIIGRFEGALPGPLLICLGGMHGNEPAGPLAVDEVLRLLRIEHIYNPGFEYQGTFVGLRGNLQAIEKGQRFIERDLNRMLNDGEITRIRSTPVEELKPEDQECLDLINTIDAEIEKNKPTVTLILDLHTTTADGGIFTIASDDTFSREVAKGLHTPVILGFEKQLQGTTLNYFHRPQDQMYCIVFEAGQHLDPTSVHRTASAIVNCMRTIGAVHSRDVDHRHDGLLIRLSQGLPRVTRLLFHYRIRPEEQFVMHPGFQNFQPIRQGDVLAENQFGGITSPHSGMILMPKYQAQGDDGFFIVEPLE